MSRSRTVAASALSVLVGCFAVGCSRADGSETPALLAGAQEAGRDAAATGSGPGFGGDDDAPAFVPTPVRKIPGLKSITYYETSGDVKGYEFLVDGPEMTKKLATLDDASHDIMGVSTEFYDVYYSDLDGNFDLNGPYLTIAGVFGFQLPAGGGLNLAEIALNYEGKPAEYGNYVASFAALGDNAVPSSVNFAIDGVLDTNTTMGNTVDDPGKLLRVTLGFASTSGPPK